MNQANSRKSWRSLLKQLPPRLLSPTLFATSFFVPDLSASLVDWITQGWMEATVWTERARGVVRVTPLAAHSTLPLIARCFPNTYEVHCRPSAFRLSNQRCFRMPRAPSYGEPPPTVTTQPAKQPRSTVTIQSPQFLDSIDQASFQEPALCKPENKGKTQQRRQTACRRARDRQSYLAVQNEIDPKSEHFSVGSPHALLLLLGKFHETFLFHSLLRSPIQLSLVLPPSWSWYCTDS